MKRFYQEDGEDIRLVIRFDQEEVVEEALVKTILDDLERAIGSHDTVLIVRRRQPSDDALPVGAAPDASMLGPAPEVRTVFKRILESSRLDTGALADLLGMTKQTPDRWLNKGFVPRRNVRFMLLRLHDEGKLTIPEDILPFIKCWTFRQGGGANQSLASR